MSEIKVALEKMEGLVKGELEEVRSELQSVKKDSARAAELNAKHDAILEDFDSLQEKVDAVQTAVNRVSGTNEAKARSEEESNIMEHKDKFEYYLRTANDAGLKEMEQKALSVGSDPDGGFVAPEEMSSQVISTIYESSPVRQAANVMQTSKKEVTFLVDKDEAGAAWVAEQGVNANTTTPQFGELKIVAHKLATEPMATEEILQDAEMNIESWLAAKVADKFARTENLAFVSGDGVGKPRGFVTYPSGTAWEQVEQVATAASTVLDELDIVELIGSLKTPYLTGASFGMSRLTNKVIRKLQDLDGNFLFTGQDLMNKTLFGYPIHIFDDMDGPTSGSTYAAGALPIVFGNIKTAYTIIERQELRILRDPYTSKGYVKFYTTRRCGGGVTNFEAIKLLSITA